MKFDLKYLILAVLVSGTVSCIGREELIKKLTDAEAAILKPSDGLKDYRKKMIHALSNPSCLIKENYILDKVDFKCKDENSHEFYRLDITDEKKLADLSEHCKTNSTLDGLKDDKLKAEIEKQFAVKSTFLMAVISNIPGFAYYLNDVTDEFDLIVQSHIMKFISSSLVYDGKRLTFSSLHKAVEGILNAHEVDRKAIDGIKAAKSLLENKDVKFELFQNVSLGFTIKPNNPPKPKQGDSKKTKVVEKKPVNIIEAVLKASDKSTSSSENLNNVLVLALSLSFGLLLFKSITAKPAKDDEEEEMEETH